jgi:hypothetical protein
MTLLDTLFDSPLAAIPFDSRIVGVYWLDILSTCRVNVKFYLRKVANLLSESPPLLVNPAWRG